MIACKKIFFVFLCAVFLFLQCSRTFALFANSKSINEKTALTATHLQFTGATNSYSACLLFSEETEEDSEEDFQDENYPDNDLFSFEHHILNLLSPSFFYSYNFLSQYKIPIHLLNGVLRI